MGENPRILPTLGGETVGILQPIKIETKASPYNPHELAGEGGNETGRMASPEFYPICNHLNIRPYLLLTPCLSLNPYYLLLSIVNK